MDKKDEKLLEMLNQNGRKSFKKLGEELEMSDVAAKNRVTKLMEKGVITGFSACVNPDKVGLSLQATIGIQVDPQKTKEVVEELRDFEEFYFIWKVTGAHNLHLHGAFEDHTHMDAVLDKALSIEGVREYHVSMMSEELKHDKVFKKETT